MKRIVKKLILLIAVCMSVSDLTLVHASQEEFNIVYFGGSATCGTDEYDTWMEQVSDVIALKNNVKVNSFFEGVCGDRSEVGQYKAWEKINCNNPDLVFIDFAADDPEGFETEYIENILLTIRQMEILPKVVLVNAARYNSSAAGMLSGNGVEIEKLAMHYGLRAIDMLMCMEQSDNIPMLFENNGVTLSQAGHNLYADEIIRVLRYGDYMHIPSTDASLYNADAKPIKYAVNTLTNSSGGSKTINFSGKSFITRHSADSTGSYKVVIDNAYTYTVKINANSSGIGYEITNLSDSFHTAVVTPLNDSYVNVCEYFTDYDAVRYSWINESFETKFTEAIAVNGGEVCVVDDGAYGRGNGLKVKSSEKSATALKFPVNFYPGRYKISCCIKTLGFVPKQGFSTFTIVVFDSKGGYNMYTVNNVNYIMDEWIYIETEIENDGTCIYAGERVEITPKNSQLQVRIGDKNGNINNTNDGKPIEYVIDNFVFEPISEPLPNSNISASLCDNMLSSDFLFNNNNIKAFSCKLMKSINGVNWECVRAAVIDVPKININLYDEGLYYLEVLAVGTDDTLYGSAKSRIFKTEDFLFEGQYTHNLIADADFANNEVEYTVLGTEDMSAEVICAQYDSGNYLLKCDTDTVMAGFDGLSMTKSICSECRTIKIIIFDSYENIRPISKSVIIRGE